MSDVIQKVDECRAGEWDALCPICGSTIDKFTAPVESYEAKCDSCERWYYLTDAICKPVGVAYEANEIRESFINIANSEPHQISVQVDNRPNGSVTKEIFNPALKRMTETVAEGVEQGWSK